MKTRLSQLTRVERQSLGQIGRAKRGRAGWKTSPPIMRLREIEKVIKARHGAFVPETDDGDLYIKAAAFALSGQDLQGWCARWAPWASPAVWMPIAAAAGKRRCMMSANGVAGLLRIPMAERDRLKLKTIGACDLSLAERRALVKKRKLDRDRKRQEQKRKAANRQDRASYLATHSISRIKPWEAEGISRPTWYRRQRETGLSRVEVSSQSGDTLVSPMDDTELPPVPVASLRKASGKAGREGLGVQPPAGHHGAEPHGSSDDISEAAA